MDVREKAAEKLCNRDETVATAESATGGKTGSMLTDVPGASDYFDRAVVTYSNVAKQQLAGVKKEALERHSAVSEVVAKQMARGVRDLSQTDWGISITGYAGPSDGGEEPVGAVYIGVAYAGTGEIPPYASVERFVFTGSREERKQKFAEQALEQLVKEIDKLEKSQ